MGIRLWERTDLSILPGKVEIDSSGTIFVDGERRNQLLVVDFPDYNYLTRLGSGSYQLLEGGELPTPAQAQVMQGSLEMSNVNIVKEMVSLIEIQRAYEANQKVVQAYDDTLGKAVNEISV